MADRERPILFSGPMIRALLQGRKTQTRRVIKDEWWRCLDPEEKEDRTEALTQCPYGQSSDRLWVRETWGLTLETNDDGEPTNARRVASPSGTAWVVYRSDHPDWIWTDGDGYSGPSCWKPSIHMPRWASRLTLEVTGVRVERLHDISEEDTRAEGVERHTEPFTYGWRNYEPSPAHESISYWPSARESFASLWRSINGAESWAANPWVWVVEFRRVEGTP